MSHHHRVLSDLYTREHLMERGKENGLQWEDHPHEGVNWMRFTNALKGHLQEDGHFHTGETDVESLERMKHHYGEIKKLHRKQMAEHIKQVMTKLHMENEDPNKRPEDFLDEAHSHLEANGGHLWSENVRTLHNLNHHIGQLEHRIKNAPKTE